MSNGLKKRKKEIEAVVDRLGFTCTCVDQSAGDHLCFHITDDEGNRFKAYTGQSCSGNAKNARLNFKQDIRRISNRLKGLIG